MLRRRPEILTRAELFEQIAAVAGRRVRILRVPAWLAGMGGAALRLVHPRIGQFAKFAVGLSRYDNIAPSLGTSTLASYSPTTGFATPRSSRSARTAREFLEVANVPANTSRSTGRRCRDRAAIGVRQNVQAVHGDGTEGQAFV